MVVGMVVLMNGSFFRWRLLDIRGILGGWFKWG